MSPRPDEDGKPATPAEVRAIAVDSPDEVLVFRLPLRLPFSRGRRRWLVVRWYAVGERTTAAVE